MKYSDFKQLVESNPAGQSLSAIFLGADMDVVQSVLGAQGLSAGAVATAVGAVETALDSATSVAVLAKAVELGISFDSEA